MERDSSRGRQRELGIFYTPSQLVEPILDEVFEPILAEMHDEVSCRARLETLRIIDPACGSGHFLLGAWRRLALTIARVVGSVSQHEALLAAATRLYGIDIDPQAGVAARRLLRAECEQWGLSPGEFPHWITIDDALLGWSGGEGEFDLVLGNPPFVDSESMCASDPPRRRDLARRYATSRGNWDLASLFVERAVQLVQSGGRIGLVLPRRLLASDYAQHVQRLMNQQTVEAIRVNDPNAFEDAVVETISLVMRAEPPVEAHLIRIVNGASSHSFAQRDLRLLPPGHWSAILAPPEPKAPDLGSIFTNLPRLVSHAFVGDGATTGEAYRLREVIVEQDATVGESVRLINTGTIDPFAQRWGRRLTRYLKSAWLRPVVPLDWLDEHLPRRAAQARSNKVLVAGLAGRIEAVVDDGTALCGKSAVQVIAGDGIDPHALCAWLNSTPINDLYRRLFESHGFGARSMHIGPRQLEQLPMWQVGDSQWADAVIELAMLSRCAHAAGGSQECQHRIDAIVDGLLR